ncbi:hypothetical protein CDD80_1780 [Ophiocordyceps camponoti-rufipedis]|uniref:Vacuolar ATP synthase subunit D n=1 Tax=Ophiocordyceps camponoti-rufipedis TaxID=2004952 RepID=A0A2C5XXF8_9HYPO|nr:hypothetical protein CDD80_1780 [Ophiocordyceps camponoti-rufipedis]
MAGSRSRLSHAAIPGHHEGKTQGSGNWAQPAEAQERSSNEVGAESPGERNSELIDVRASPRRFREITRRIDEAKRKMGRVMQIAAFSLAEVTYAVGGDIGYQVQESAKSARFRIRTKQDNVSGVLLPAFESHTVEGSNDFSMTGLGKGGQQVQRCRETYARAVEALVELASLQTAFVILDEVIKVSMQLNMLSYRGRKTPSATSIRNSMN